MSYVQSARLLVCRWFAAAALGGLALSAAAQSEIPFNTSKNSLEYKAASGTYTWQPVGSETPRSAQPYRPDLSGGSVSSVEPKAKWTPALPYQHKGGSGMKATFTAMASKAAVAGAAAAELAKGAVACGAKPGNPIVVSAAIAGCMGGTLLVSAAIDWGFSKLVPNDDGSFTVISPDPSAQYETSTGYYWTSNERSTLYGYSPRATCQLNINAINRPEWSSISSFVQSSATVYRCTIGGYGTITITRGASQTVCPSGHFVSSQNVCFQGEPTITRPLADAVNQKIVSSPWGLGAARAMAGVMMAGHNVFTDGTSGTITGPSTVPLGTTSDSWPVNVLPGTTTEAPVGYTGSTDPGTKTSTTTKQANNTYSGNTQTATTGSTTTTNVTNNITNNTSTNVTTNTQQSDEPPKEEEKDFCQKNPDALACAEADTPEQDVPRREINISYEYADIFGNGACPSDAYLNTHGMTLKVWDWQATCSNVQDYVKPVLIACCAFGAYLIIVGVKE